MPRRYNVKPTPKQIRALELIRQGEKPTVAMRKVGYSAKVAKAPKQNLLSHTGALTIIEQHKAEYAALGIIPNYYVQKVKDLMEATKIDHSHTEPDQTVPDWKARAKGLEFYRQDIGLAQQSTNIVAGGNMNIEFNLKDENRST